MRKRTRKSTKEAALEKLPPDHRTHWVARRKAQVVQAIRRGWLSIDEARTRYKLSFEELIAWQHAFSRGGRDGLKSAHLRRYHRQRH